MKKFIPFLLISFFFISTNRIFAQTELEATVDSLTNQVNALNHKVEYLNTYTQWLELHNEIYHTQMEFSLTYRTLLNEMKSKKDLRYSSYDLFNKSYTQYLELLSVLEERFNLYSGELSLKNFLNYYSESEYNSLETKQKQIKAVFNFLHEQLTGMQESLDLYRKNL